MTQIIEVCKMFWLKIVNCVYGTKARDIVLSTSIMLVLFEHMDTHFNTQIFSELFSLG